MNLKILPSTLSGDISVPESKSVSHRLIIAWAISQLQQSRTALDSISFKNLEDLLVNPSDDILATIDCCKNIVSLTPLGNCRNSGTTFRLLLPVYGVLFDNFTLNVGEQLSKRPVDTLTNAMAKGGCDVVMDHLSFHGNGHFKGGIYSLPGDISSQYISALLFALPLTEEGGTIEITTQLESRPYVDLTLKVLRDFNIEINEKSIIHDGKHFTVFDIPGKQQYICPFQDKFVFEKDWSSAAFWYAANFIGQSINIQHMDFNSLQGDKEIIEILMKYKSSSDLTVDVKNIPDLVPILAIAASFRKEGTKVFFTNTQRLKIKESDRQMSTMDMVNSMGGIALETEKGFYITSTGGLKGGLVQSYDDHRIAMAAAIGGCNSQDGVTITNYKCVEKSYPDFYTHLIQLGGKIAKL